MPVIGSVVFAGAAIVALSVIAYTVAPCWQRIIRTAFGYPDAPPSERWRSVHLAADRRRPFHEIRGGTPHRRRRGLFGRGAQ